MRALIQRVSSASVSVEGEEVASIGEGLLVLLGVGRGDGPQDAERLAAKVLALRVFEDERGRMGRSVRDVGGAVLCVSQFTLYADTRPATGRASRTPPLPRRRRPSTSASGRPWARRAGASGPGWPSSSSTRVR